MWNQARKQEIKERELERKGKERKENWKRTGNKGNWIVSVELEIKGTGKKGKIKGKELGITRESGEELGKEREKIWKRTGNKGNWK